jgi:hypothetical protein
MFLRSLENQDGNLEGLKTTKGTKLILQKCNASYSAHVLESISVVVKVSN